MKLIRVAAVFLPFLLLAAGQAEEEEEEEEEDDTERPPYKGPALQPLCDLAALYSYKCEKHLVETKDGYKLDLHRILPAKEPTKRVIMLVHGMLLSGEIYAIFNDSIAYQLADEGHDVWLAGLRGTVHGRNHKTLNPDKDAEFWNHSFQEVGMYDIPSQVDYIIEKTKAEQIDYLGHSLGTTVFFVMANKLPDTANKVKNVILLAPVYFFSKFQFMLKEGSSMYNMTVDTMKSYDEKQKWEAFPRSDMPKTEHQINCDDLPTMGVTYCNMGLDMSKQKVGDFMPAGTPKKTLDHMLQCVIHGKAAFFDNGEEMNKKIYGQSTPPEIDIKSTNHKYNVIYCESDNLAPPQDVEMFLNETNIETKYYVEDEGFNHMDFIFPTTEENEKIYAVIMKKLKDILNK